MWKREEPIQAVPPRVTSTTGSGRQAGSRANRDAVVGKSIVVKGELHGGENLTIEGQVEGRITLERHVLTIGTHGRVQAEVFAKSVVIRGEVVGDIAAAETVSISAEGRVEGDIKAARVAIAEGARFHGGIDMQQGRQAHRTPSEPKHEPGPRPPASALRSD